MTSGTSTIETRPAVTRVGLFAGRRGRILKENLTAYLFLFPATFLILIFGLFPVAFSLYVSLYRWKLKQGAFRGLGNYVNALDTLAYVIAFGLAIGAFWLAATYLIRSWRLAAEHHEQPWFLVAPGVLWGLAVVAFIRFFALALPEILSIGEKVQRLEKTREIFIQFFREAFQVEAVVQARQEMLWLALGGLVLTIISFRLVKSRRNATYLALFTGATFFVLVGYQLGLFTYTSIQEAYAEALESGEEIAIWTQIVTISAGGLLLYLSWKFWQNAGQAAGSVMMVLRLLAAISLLVGAWLLIGIIPPVLAAGDEDMWDGLVVTAWYSFLTVPIQLALGISIAYLLFQNIKGKSFYRMMYFLPYITPAVAAAAVFRILFSNRPTGMMNQLWTALGGQPLAWLLEPKSVFDLGFIAGPSLALVVIILFNVWSFAGYNAVIFLAGLGGIPPTLYEAAEIDGASRWQSFRHITLPLLSPTTYFLSLLGVIGTFKAFTHIYVLRQEAALNSVDTISLVIWDELFTRNEYGYAATLAFVLFGVVLILTLINNKVQGEAVFYG
jgi:multiple sugar transport system permease protein